MRKLSDSLKNIHSYIGENVQRDIKLLNSIHIKIRILFFGLALYFIVIGTIHVFFEEYIAGIIMYGFTLLPILLYRRSAKRSRRLMDRLQNQKEEIENIGKDLYDASEDEKLT